jgi:four helix bundle protein
LKADKLRDYKKIETWKRSHALVLRVYHLTEEFPANEKYNIVSQLRRASLSIPTNIAEGCGRSTESELARFMDIASDSASEIDYLLYLAMDLKYIDAVTYSVISNELTVIRKMLFSYIKTVRNTNS